jgi:hypothetical protein
MRGFRASLVIVGVVSLVGGCVSSANLNDLLRQYGYEPMTPPMTKWEPGTVVEVSRWGPGAPQYLVAPSDLQITIPTFDPAAPDVTQTHERKYGLDVGVRVPEALRIKLEAKGASQYSVVARGNQIRTVKLFAYYREFKKLAAKAREVYGGDIWDRQLRNESGFYLSSLWYATELEYRFYNDVGARLAFDPPLDEVPAAGGGGWKARTDGTVSYRGTEPICIGFQKRPVRAGAVGPVAEAPGAAGGLTVQALEARHRQGG